jgi:site-specific DNA recombinase
MRAAIYARVSTNRQHHDQTIDSQIAALRQWADGHGHQLRPEHVFTDDGYSGTRLDRPALDRLRDAAREGDVDVVAVYSPDRLARKYAYQVLLMEELRRAGCEVAFVQRPISDDPHDQLLLQIQGAIAEYEKAVLGERFRRGKLQKARAGQWVTSKAPYGYRYVPKRDGVPGHLVTEPAEAEVVRMLYRWLIDERMTVRQILKRLAQGPWRPRNGKRLWSGCVVHRILSDPAYTGTAYANRYTYVVPRKPRMRGPRAGEATCRRPRPREEWIPIPVPAIVDEAAHQGALAQLARNSVLNFRRNTRNSYLLRCLLVCRACGLAMHGTTTRGKQGNLIQGYYRCHGKDPAARDREHRCPQSRVKVEELDAAVWDHVCQLLDDPATLLAQFEALARPDADEAAGGPVGEDKAEAQLRRLDREGKRLLDAYQAEAIELAELRERQRQIEGRRQVLLAQRDLQAQVREERRTARQVWGDLTTFCERIRSRLGEATAVERQQILQLLVERVIVGEDALEIRHVIPLRRLKSEPVTSVPAGDGGEGQTPAGSSEGPPGAPEPRLRSDGVSPAGHANHVRPGAESIVPGEGISLEITRKAFEKPLGTVAGVTRREVVHAVGVQDVTEIDPEPPGSRPGKRRVPDRHRRVIGPDDPRAPDSPDHQVVEGCAQLGRLSQPTAERAPRDRHAVMRQDLLLAVERQMIGELVGDHVGQETRAGQSFVDRLGRLGRDRHMLLTRSTRILAADELADEKRGRNVVQLLADLIVEMGAKPATTRAGSFLLGEFDDDRHARQVLGEGLPTATLPGPLRLLGALGLGVGVLRRGRLVALVGEEP